MEAALIIVVVMLLIALFALKSEIVSFDDVQRVIPVWELPPEKQQEQYISLACYASDVRVAWRSTLLATIVSVLAVWLLSGLVLNVYQLLALSAVIFFVFYFFASFTGYHYYKELCKKARPNWVQERPKGGLGTCAAGEPRSASASE